MLRELDCQLVENEIAEHRDVVAELEAKVVDLASFRMRAQSTLDKLRRVAESMKSVSYDLGV